MRYRKKKRSKTEKKHGVCFHAEKNGMCTGKKKCEKQIHTQNIQNYKILEFTEFGSA